MSDSSSILVFALQIASSFIVISLVLVIIVFRVVRYKIKPHNKNNWSTHVFKVTSQYQVHTYSEIDEKNTRGTEFNIPIELRNNELIEQLQDAYAAKYTELPAKNTAEMPG